MNFKSFLILCCLISYPANAEVSKKSGFKVGDTKQSILSETQFQSIHGPEWVKLRGQVITTSKLCVKFSICTLPNAEGRFLRDSVADAGLRSIPDDTTAKNGLALTGNVAGGTASLTGNISGGSISDPGHKHNVGYQQVNRATGADIPTHYLGAILYDVYDTDTKSTGITHVAANNGDLGVTNDPAENGNLAVGDGDGETAPDHLVVNTFIKIN